MIPSVNIALDTKTSILLQSIRRTTLGELFPEHFAEVLQQSALHEIGKGHSLQRLIAIPDSLYLLFEGQIRISSKVWNGKRFVILIIERGGAIGSGFSQQSCSNDNRLYSNTEIIPLRLTESKLQPGSYRDSVLNLKRKKLIEVERKKIFAGYEQILFVISNDTFSARLAALMLHLLKLGKFSDGRLPMRLSQREISERSLGSRQRVS